MLATIYKKVNKLGKEFLIFGCIGIAVSGVGHFVNDGMTVDIQITSLVGSIIVAIFIYCSWLKGFEMHNRHFTEGEVDWFSDQFRIILNVVNSFPSQYRVLYWIQPFMLFRRSKST